MAGVVLERLLGHRSEIGRVLTSLSDELGIRVSIEDAEGKVIFGASSGQSQQRYPVELDDQILGWVSGDEKAAPLAGLINYAVRQESEKKSLGSELVERYRELSLLYHLSEHMAASPQSDALTEIALEEVRRLIKAHAGTILLLDEGHLQSAAAFGVPYQFIQHAPTLEHILQTGKAELTSDISVEDCIEAEQGYQISLLGAPLKTERGMLGVIVLVRMQPQAFTAGELKLINTIALQVAPALEISRLYQELIEKARFEHELKMARQVQESLLPLRLPEIPGWVVAKRWRPAREVSGDFYDVIANGQAVDLVIADVTDKGMPASLFMALTRSILRVSIYAGGRPANIITSVNQSICRDSVEGLFTTLVYVHLDPETGFLTYVNAGHNPPLLYHARSGEMELLGRTGLPLGVDQESTYTQNRAFMEVGDFILFYTDGVTEAININEKEFGLERLSQQVLRYRDYAMEDLLDGIETAVLEFTLKTQQTDDMTIMGLKRIQAQGA